MSESKISFDKLRNLNLVAAGLHFAQAGLILYLSKSFTLPVTTSYLQFNVATQSLAPVTKTLFNINLAYLVVAFLFMSGIAHLLITTVWRNGYEADLAKGMNRARWIEYSVSASTMIVAIAMLTGIYDIVTLLALFALTAVMNLCGLIMEVHNQTTKKTSWLSFWVGSFAGIIPWIGIALTFWASAQFGVGDAKIPTFVYYIFVSLFIFFNCFAINMVLQYKKIGPWRDYLYGERAYIILSLVAKSALAWQVFAGTLRP